MTEEPENKIVLISKKIKKLTLSGQSFDEKELSVQGDNLKEIKKVFDEEWKE